MNSLNLERFRNIILGDPSPSALDIRTKIQEVAQIANRLNDLASEEENWRKASALGTLALDLQKALEVFYLEYNAAELCRKTRDHLVEVGWEGFVQMLPKEYLSIVDAIDLKFGSADNPFEEFVFDFDWHLVPLSGSDPRKWIPEDWETLCRHFSATYTMIFR
jgi:hypothetical protein